MAGLPWNQWPICRGIRTTGQGLGPLGLFLTPENPPLVVLRLDNEDAVARSDDVVDLGRAVAGVQGDVVDGAIRLLVQEQFARQASHGLANHAFQQGCQGHRVTSILVPITPRGY